MKTQGLKTVTQLEKYLIAAIFSAALVGTLFTTPAAAHHNYLLKAEGKGMISSSTIEGVLVKGSLHVYWLRDSQYVIAVDNKISGGWAYLDPKGTRIYDAGSAITLTGKIMKSDVAGLKVGDTVSCTIDVGKTSVSCKNLSKSTSVTATMFSYYILKW